MIKKLRIGGVSWNYIQKRNLFIWYFGFEGFKEFTLDDDRNLLNTILYGTEKFDKKDNKITLITLKFSMLEYEKIRKKIDWLILQLIYYN